MWPKMKAYLRKVKAGTKEVLEAAIADALNLISISDILGLFAEDGYVHNKFNCFKTWVKAAGINKKVSFHVARHSIFSYRLKINELQSQKNRQVTI
jgi:hypothetical protein